MTINAVRGRVAKQVRSLHTREKIAAAAVNVLASHGVAGLTHRLVASNAGVPLAATTYHFDTKFDIVAEASNKILAGYIEAFHRAAERFRARPAGPRAFADFVRRLVRNSSGRTRTETIAWAEMMLDGARHPESLILAQEWFRQFGDVWRTIADILAIEDSTGTARSAIDVVIGLIFVTISLGLTEQQVDAVLGDDSCPRVMLRPTNRSPSSDLRGGVFGGPKAARTRAKILATTIEMLIAAGPTAISFPAVAAAAGLSRAAPFYHFRTSALMLRAAQDELFQESKARYRSVMIAANHRVFDVNQLIELTATIFVREATEFGARSLANYAIWIQAAREPELRSMIWGAVDDQLIAWNGRFDELLATPRPIDSLLMQCVFIGKLIRIIATGARMQDLVIVRSEFARDMSDIVSKNFWLTKRYK